MREEKILADRQLAKSGQQMNALLAACWQETLDPGPYTFGHAAPDWDAVLQGDRFFILLKVRTLTYGETYDFSVDCSSEQCGRRIAWSLSLDDLPVRELPGASRAALAANTPLQATLPGCGKQVNFRLGTGAHERQLAALRERQPHRVLSAKLAQRIVEVEGIAPGDTRAFLEDLSMRDANFLLSHFETVDCGVETAIEIECPHCLRVQDLDLPLEAGFLWPSKQKAAYSRTATQDS